MDVYLAVASKRDVRDYDGAPLPAEVERRILDAGRLAGSAANRQTSRLVVVEGRLRETVAAQVYTPANVLRSGLAVAIVASPGGGLLDFDAGRAAQNMMLVAWEAGVGSCPNGVREPVALHDALDLASEERAVVVLTFGRPRRARDPRRRSAEEWSARARRLPLAEVVRRAGGGA